MLDARSNAIENKAMWPMRVKSRKFTLRPFFILSLAVIFSFNVLGGDLLIGEVWAARVPELTSVGSDNTGGPTPLKDLKADTFSLPQELGYIQESVKVPDSTRTVIHIQDAHCNYAAQKSIAGILDYLTTEYGIYAVNCEGGAEGYDLSVFTSIEDKPAREKTADYFVKEGVVSAAEYYAVNNPQKVALWGVEDPDLYIKNLKVYRDSLSHKAQVDRYIKSISHILDNLKRHIYSDGLMEFDGHYTGYKEGKIKFKEYVLYLITTAQKRMIDIKAFPNIYLLSQTLKEEDGINFKRANNERDDVVERLKKVLSRNEIAELMNNVAQVKAERISQSDFYAYLVKKAKSIKLNIAEYPELQKYIIYISMYSAMDRTKVSNEIDALEDKIKESLYENDTQRELGILSKNLTLIKNIFNISITRDDYNYYKEHISAFSVVNYINFIDRLAPLYKIQAALDSNIAMLDQYRDAMNQFYECSLERDKAFIKNIKFTDHARPNSIIITGGFHTENLRELFNNEKVSYVSIMPKFKNERDYESPYLKRLAGQKTALENVIDTAIPAVLNLQVVEILTRLGIMVEGRAAMERFKLAVAILGAINSGRLFILKIDANVRLEGLDDEGEKFITFTKGSGAEAVTHKMDLASSISADTKAALERQINAELTAEGIKYITGPVQTAPAAPSEAVQTPPQPAPPAAASAAGSKALDQNTRTLTDNLRRGVYNIFVMKATDETISGQTAIGRQGAGIFEKKFGLSTVILYYTNAASREVQLNRMAQLLKENESKHSMGFINCLNKEELEAANKFLNAHTPLKDTVAVAKDFKEGEKEIAIPDEARVIIVGSAIMNDRRLSKVFGMKPDELYQNRMETLYLLNANGVIDDADFDAVRDLDLSRASELNIFMDRIWRGDISLNCTKVDWKNFDDWKNAQRQLLQAV